MLFLINLTVTNCDKAPFIPIYDVDLEFQPLVDSFILEATRRGQAIEIDNLILKYSEDLDPVLCGGCNSLDDPKVTQKAISIKPGNTCWEKPEELEILVFHELGHCILGRSHLADTLPNGDPKSLMIDGNLTVYAPCRYVFGQTEDCNNVHKRAYYLDELFDPETPVPAWAK